MNARILTLSIDPNSLDYEGQMKLLHMNLGHLEKILEYINPDSGNTLDPETTRTVLLRLLASMSSVSAVMVCHLNECQKIKKGQS